MYEANKEFAHAESIFWPVLVNVPVHTKTGTQVNMPTINPLALIHHTYHQGGAFTDMFTEKIKTIFKMI